MDATHPKGRDLIPTFYGHSIGRWEGDTLVVDTVGFNEQNWIDAEGLMHTDQYHQIERFTRTDFNTLRYEVTIDDPGAYTHRGPQASCFDGKQARRSSNTSVSRTTTIPT